MRECAWLSETEERSAVVVFIVEHVHPHRGISLVTIGIIYSSFGCVLVMVSIGAWKRTLAGKTVNSTV